ncbi:MAG: HesA/MoeB/ThiF family protein [Planctomycetota bacterium]|jgi:molybdopterin/thiamine biosynthesis adenylyltransferase
MPKFVGQPASVDSRAALADTTVLLEGIGSVGGRIADHCGRCHIGKIALVDGKRFGAGFDTQVIRGPADVGRFKASRVGRWIRDVSPQTTVHALDTPLEALPLWMLDDYDVVMASTDNLAAEVEIGRRCLALGIPLIYASVHGATLTVQMRTFTNRGPDCPCPACGFSAAEWRQLDNDVRFSCAPDAGDAVTSVGGQPTSSVSPLCSMVADMAMLELLRVRLRLGAPLEDRLVEYNGYNHTTTVSRLARNPRCPVDHAHTVLDRAGIGQPLADCTLRDCAAAAGAGAEDDLARTSFSVDDLAFASVATCCACGADQPLNRFVAREARLRRRCRDCGRHLVPHPFYSSPRCCFAGAEGAALLDAPLRSLGARPRSVIVRSPARAVFIQHRPDDGDDVT